MIGPAAVAACVLVPACAGAGTARPPVSLVASPAHVTLADRARQTIRVTNAGSEAVTVEVTRAGFALDLRGRPRIVPRRPGSGPAAPWLIFRPRRLALAAGGAASLTVLAKLPRPAQPGDHSALVLLTTRPRFRAGLAVRMRIGIVVVARAPGRIVRRLRLVGLSVRRVGHLRLVELTVVNQGNTKETLTSQCLAISLRRDGRRLALLRPVVRDLLPRTRGVVEFRYRGGARGRLIARIEPSGRSPCLESLRRTQRISL
jgi:hypothetical protein